METYSFRRIVSYSSYAKFLREVPIDSGPRELLFDFKDAVFLHPDGMAPLVATIHHLYEECGWSIDVAYPSDPHLQDYFDKAGWTAGILGEKPNDAPIGASYVPLSGYDSLTELNGIVVSVMDCLRRTAHYEAGVLDAVEWSLNEVADNVLLHAGEEARGWIQVASRPKEHQVEIVVADCGRGVTASLREGFPELQKDAEALRRSIEKGITRSRSVGLGNGLNGVLRIAEAAGGWANFHSGAASLRVRNDGFRAMQASAGVHQGLVVTVTLPTNLQIDLTTALWGRNPVSTYENANASELGVRFSVAANATSVGNRPSARPLRTTVENLLKQFPNDVVLVDFSGIGVVASSFADEFLGRLAEALGETDFTARIELVGASELIRRTVDAVIRQRRTPQRTAERSS